MCVSETGLVGYEAQPAVAGRSNPLRSQVTSFTIYVFLRGEKGLQFLQNNVFWDSGFLKWMEKTEIRIWQIQAVVLQASSELTCSGTYHSFGRQFRFQSLRNSRFREC